MEQKKLEIDDRERSERKMGGRKKLHGKTEIMVKINRYANI